MQINNTAKLTDDQTWCEIDYRNAIISTLNAPRSDYSGISDELRLNKIRSQNYRFLLPQVKYSQPKKKRLISTDLGRVERVMHDICKFYEISLTDFTSPCRAKLLVQARRCFCFVLKKSGYSTTQIGKYLNRDHSTVINACASYPQKARAFDREVFSVIYETYFASGVVSANLVDFTYDAIETNLAIARQVAHRARGIETTLGEKAFRAHLQCLLVSIMEHYGFNINEIAHVRACAPERIEKRCRYIAQHCPHEEILQLREDIIDRLDILRGAA